MLLQKDQLNKAFENESALLVNLIDPTMADEVVANAQATNSRLIFFNRQPSDSALEAYDEYLMHRDLPIRTKGSGCF